MKGGGEGPGVGRGRENRNVVAPEKKFRRGRVCVKLGKWEMEDLCSTSAKVVPYGLESGFKPWKEPGMRRSGGPK